MISALQWVPRGAMERNPTRFIPSKEEMEMTKLMVEEEMSKTMETLGMDDEDEDESNTSNIPSEELGEDGLPASFRMDEYDDEDNSAVLENLNGQTDCMEDIDMGQTDVDAEFLEEDEKEDEFDKEDVEIRDTDAILLVANTEEDFSSLEVHVYEDESASLYVHHEIALPAFPLCLSWMDCPPVKLEENEQAGKGSFVAVGTFKPGIEIWNLDVLDALEPSAVLGGEEDFGLRNVAIPTGRRSDRTTLKPGSHEDAVMGLDWNRGHRNMLASSSADTTVKLWDITTQSCLHTMNHHSDKVQCVQWNPVETTVLASAAFDGSLKVLDCRSPESVASFGLHADVEKLAWNPHNPAVVFVSLEDGSVLGYDVRNANKPAINFKAHSTAVSGISFSTIPGLFATASTDKTVKVWDLNENTPTCVASKEMAVGELFTVSFYKDFPYMLATGGGKGTLALWDISENQGIEKKFSDRIPITGETQTNQFEFRLATPDNIADELMKEEEVATQSSKKKKSKKIKKKKL